MKGRRTGTEPSYFSDLIANLDFDRDDFNERQKHIKNMLYRYINLKTVVAFIGSGCSAPLKYPLWNQFAKKILAQTVSQLAAAGSDGGDTFKRLKRYQKYYRARRLTTEMSAQVVLRECERALSAAEGHRGPHSGTFRRLVQAEFREHAGRPKTEALRENRKKNPYRALLGLPIKRFVTTNYDMELERALHREGRLTKGEMFETDRPGDGMAGIEREAITKNGLSFTQKDVNDRQLTRIPLARCELSEYMVFHCHGRIDDMDSCIITEEDYQEWYLRDAPGKQMFNQTLDLLFGSNPILFLGYSLSDPDLTRWLRRVTANRPVERTRCPLFALQYFPESDFGASGRWIDRRHVEDECDALYVRYGLHVIPVFEKKRGPGRMDLCVALEEMEREWRQWWDGVNLKPRFRRFQMAHVPDESYYHYRFELSPAVHIEKVYGRLEADLRQKLAALDAPEGEGRPKLLVILGGGGTGKSWGVQYFLNRLQESPEGRGKRVLFWSSYYSNDVFTCINRTVEFFDKCRGPVDGRPAGSRFADRLERLRAHLKNKENVIVFDGVEKLLELRRGTNEWRAISAEVVEFFRLLSDPEVCQSSVILTSRYWSDDFLAGWGGDAPKAGGPEARRQRLRAEMTINAPVCKYELIQGEADFRHIDHELCSLLEGHVYCIALAGAILNNHDARGDSGRRAAALLKRDIANTPPDRRVQRVIREAIQAADKTFEEKIDVEEFKGRGLALAFLERLVLFLHPVSTETARVCLEQAARAVAGPGFDFSPDAGLTTAALNHLSERCLIQKIKLPAETRYTMHPTVKEYIFQSVHNAAFSSNPTLQLPGYTSSSETVDPGSERAVKAATELFYALCREAEEAKKGGKAGGGAEDAAIMCRGAFSLLRARFCANTVARWGNYRDYLEMVFRLYDTVKSVAGEYWAYEETLEDASSDGPHLPLYPNEMAWVYNEVGLTSSGMGNMLNTLAMWQQGYEINKLIDPDSNGRYYLQSLFNLGVGFIHFGRLPKAIRYLNDALKRANALSNKQIASRITAYLALVQYLQGDLRSADKTFESAYEGLADNPRALSVFYCHHAEILLKSDDPDRAREKIMASRYLAEASYFPDLLAYSRLASANLLLKAGEFGLAQDEYEFALEQARKFKLRRLESGALSGLSRLAYELNDSELARQKAVEALKIANEFHLRLHQTQSLIAMGKALLLGGNSQFGISFLQTARELAKRQGYFLRMHEAECELQKHRASHAAKLANYS